MPEQLTGVALRSLITSTGDLRISLEPVQVGRPGEGELVVRVEAAPINPSDLGLLLGPIDLTTICDGGGPEPTLVGKVPQQRLAAVSGRLDQPMPVGNEGAGIVVRAGPDVQHLIGRTVGMIGGGMYAHYRLIAARDCIVLPEAARPAEAASLFVNPLTALGFVETMRADGHTAIIHTAAASNLGQMLVRVCLADRIPLVNVVRSSEQEALLRSLGAAHIVNSSEAGFPGKLEDSIAATGATIAFDAIGGGEFASQILAAMEKVASKKAVGYNRYGSDTFKQVYIYGALDVAPTILTRSFGFSWSLGGWLLFPFLQKAGAETAQRLRDRVAAEYNTTFASRYTQTISLREAIEPDTVRAYERKSTGAKYLINPQLDVERG